MNAKNKTIVPEKIKNDFKADDIVYYNKPDDLFDHHHAYVLYQGTFKSSFKVKEGNMLTGVVKDFVDTNFISEKEYEAKYGVTMMPDTNIVVRKVGNYKSFVSKFKTGDVVYYVGDKIARLSNNKPYKVEFYNPDTGLMKLEGNVIPTDNIITEEDYEKLKLINVDSNIPTEKGKEKTEMDIKMTIFKDTRDDKLKWFRPYATHEDWFRTTIKLESPPKSYLRIDVETIKEKLEMRIYYHRTGNNRPPQENSTLIKTYIESQIIRSLVKLIEDGIDPIDISFKN